MRRALIPFAFCAALAAPALAGDLTVIVNRTDKGTELYLSAPAGALFDLTGTPVSTVPGGGSAVDIAAFASGTWVIGDALFARAQMDIAGAPAPVEAMSFMLHDAAEKMPMDTPLDALMAIELCNVAEPGLARDWDSLIGYAGYYTPAVAGAQRISLALPNAVPVTATVIDASADGAQRSWEATLQPGTPLVLEPPQSRQGALWPLGALALAAAVLGAGLLGRFRRA